MPLPAVCDWCDNPPVITHPDLGCLCWSCLTGQPGTNPGDGGDGHHYQLRHGQMSECFAAPSAAEALERLRTYLDTTVPSHKYGPVITAAIHDGTADILIEQGLCIPTAGENVQLTYCYCDTPDAQ